MRIAVYGGSFDPPHTGHVSAAGAACRALCPDRLIVIPDYRAPHKEMAENGASPQERLDMCRIAFEGLKGCEVSDIELCRGGKSYTSDTLRQLMELYPGAELILLIGTDMLMSFEGWHEARWMLENIRLAVFPREDGELPLIEKTAAGFEEKYGSRIYIVRTQAVPAASREIRQLLQNRLGTEYLSDGVYSYIIKRRLYGAKPSFPWLREKAYAMLKPKRIPHVAGCEQEAVKLARRWGADPDEAAEAGILHDITKKLELNEQLILCRKYGIILDEVEQRSVKLLHAKTGAAIARDEFGVSDEVYEAIKWHTTGKADMSLLEKIIYMADYIEPTRDFEGVDRLRRLAYSDLDAAMVLGFEMSIEDIRSYGVEPHEKTFEALAWYKRGKNER